MSKRESYCELWALDAINQIDGSIFVLWHVIFTGKKWQCESEYQRLTGCICDIVERINA